MSASPEAMAALEQRVRRMTARLEGVRDGLADQRPTDEQIAELDAEMAAIHADLEALRD